MTDYTLYYWPIPFRGHFIRYVLAHVGATWAEAGMDATADLKARPVGDQPYPFMAPPMIHDHGADRWLCQMPAIVMYLLRKHGVGGDPDDALRLLSDACDILLEITRHHGEQMWDRTAWQSFTGDRLPRWMQIHEACVRAGGLTAEDMGAEALILAALWHTMVDALPGLRPLLHDTAPGLEALVDSVAETPPIAALLAAWRDSPARYCAGQIEASILDMLTEGDSA